MGSSRDLPFCCPAGPGSFSFRRGLRYIGAAASCLLPMAWAAAALCLVAPSPALASGGDDPPPAAADVTAAADDRAADDDAVDDAVGQGDAVGQDDAVGQGDAVDEGNSVGEGGESPGDASEWIALFDGRTLDGWVQRGGRAKFFVQRGELVGATRIGTADSFLCTERRYSDFELELEFKIDPRINAGVQIRSHSDPEFEAGVVYGYQVEIDPSERAWTGGIFDASRRGWLVSLEKRPDARAAFRPEQWNTLRIVARGPQIATWINGVAAAELHDDLTAEGFIALQVHRTDLAESREVRWRNIRLRPLSSP